MTRESPLANAMRIKCALAYSVFTGATSRYSHVEPPTFFDKGHPFNVLNQLLSEYMPQSPVWTTKYTGRIGQSFNPLRALTKRSIYGATTAFLRIHPYNPYHTIYTRLLCYTPRYNPLSTGYIAGLLLLTTSHPVSFPLASQRHE